ncbi:MAG: hypothetical protein AB1Y25_05910 [Cycloclasticus sp.]
MKFRYVLLLVPVLFSVVVHAQQGAVESTSAYKEIMEKLPTVLDYLKDHKNALRAKGVDVQDASYDAGKPIEEIKKKLEQPFRRVFNSAFQKRDPFANSQRMHERLQSGDSGEAFSFRAQPNAYIPGLKLRGILDGESEDERLGLIEVASEGVFLVREGDTFSVRSAGSNVVVLVKEINNLSLMVEMGTLGEVIIVR